MSDTENRSSLSEIKEKKTRGHTAQITERFKRTVIDCGKTLTTPALIST